MPIKFNCHKCGANLRVPEKHIGKKARCPKCDEKCVVPETSQREAPRPAISAGFEDLDSFLDQPPPPAATPVGLPPAPGVSLSPPLAAPAMAAPAMATPVAPPFAATGPPSGVASPYSSPMPRKSRGGGGKYSTLMQPLYEARTMMKVWGWMTFIFGILYCLTIVGIIIAWLFIWMGWLVKGAAEAITIGVETGDQEQLLLANQRLGTFFKILGVMSIISLCFIALYILMVIVIIIVGLAGAAA